jgi:hypothetical protein
MTVLIYRDLGHDVAYRKVGNTLYKGLTNEIAFTIDTDGRTLYEGLGLEIAAKLDGNTIYKSTGMEIIGKIEEERVYEGLGANISHSWGISSDKTPDSISSHNDSSYSSRDDASTSGSLDWWRTSPSDDLSWWDD